jgi:hypothetical protein
MGGWKELTPVLIYIFKWDKQIKLKKDIITMPQKSKSQKLGTSFIEFLGVGTQSLEALGKN